MSFDFLPAIASDPLSTPSRRGFLKAAGNATSFWFLHTETGESWAVDNPVSWSLANAQQPVLERAREGLLNLTPADNIRIIRLVTRRCRLNLIEIRPNRVVVHFWGKTTSDMKRQDGQLNFIRRPGGQGDLRPFFKRHGLARKSIKVTLIDRKREAGTVQSGDDFLYGERLPRLFWPLDVYWVRVYWGKWQRRHIDEPDDWTAAPCSWSNFCWEGVKQRYIPWRVMKSAWRKENAPLCQNCDKPTILITFG
jgi:hypothetical protein